jgi:hypothetical protein
VWAQAAKPPAKEEKAGETKPAPDAKPADPKAPAAKPGEAAKPAETKPADKTKPTPPPAATTAAPGTPAATGTPATKPATGAPKATTATGPVDGATYVVRLRELEARVDELKEQIRRSHTRLSLLSDTILSGGVGGARAEITFTNDMSSAFRLTRALFVLDGAVQYNKQDDTGALAAQRTIPIFSGSVPPGDHTLQVLIQLRGHGYGVFSYLRGYRFEVKSSHAFTVTEGKAIQLEAIAYEKGGVTTPLEQRPAIRYVEKITAMGSPGAAPAPASRPAGQSKSGASGSFSVGTGGK